MFGELLGPTKKPKTPKMTQREVSGRSHAPLSASEWSKATLCPSSSGVGQGKKGVIANAFVYVKVPGGPVPE